MILKLGVKLMQWLNNFFQVILFIGLFLTVVGSIGKSILDNKQNKIVDKNRINQSKKIDTLIVNVETVNKQLEPFAEFAKQKYPDKELDVALEMLKSDIESTKIRMDSLETKNMQLEKKIKPRLIEQNKVKYLIETFKIDKKKSVSLECENGDSEGLQLMNQIRDIFINAGWRVEFSQMTRINPIKGLYVIGKNNVYDDDAKMVQDSFHFLNMQKAEFSDSKPKNLTILIGLKN